MATAAGEISFVKEFLQNNPQAKPKAVNEAWTAAGMEGTISYPVISKVRQELGLTEKTKKSPTGKKRGRPRKEATAAVTGQPQGRKGFRIVTLSDLDTDIDRLIFEAMGVGNLTEFEDTLRRARRLLYKALNRA